MISVQSILILTCFSTKLITSDRIAESLSKELSSQKNISTLIRNRTDNTRIYGTGMIKIYTSEPLIFSQTKRARKRMKLQVVTSIVGNDKVQLEKNDCILEICKRCISLFRHDVYTTEANFVYLKLNPASGVSIRGSKNIVGEDLWVWTFFGKDGGKEFLNWPIEFGIYSIGLLTSYVLTKPQTITLEKKSGNCSNLKVGRRKDDESISNALLNLTLEMMQFSPEKYGPSFYCYKRRKIIKSDILYIFCKHIVCPLEALEYNCCSYYYESSIQGRRITCRFPQHVIEYETVTWVLPIIISMVLFAYFPLLLLYLAHILFDQKIEHPDDMSDMPSLEIQKTNITPDKIVWLTEKQHITLFKTLFSPIRKCLKFLLSRQSGVCQSFLNRLNRVLFLLASLLIIGLQVCIDFLFLRSFVSTCVSKGVPMGFRSLIVGFEESKQNFLPYFGGPFIAIGMYLLITCVLIILPDNISSLLISGLPGNSVNENVSPLCIRLQSVERFGSVNFRKKDGFIKLYSVFLAQFYMFINGKYWQHIFLVQRVRWQNWYCTRICIMFFPLYIIFCALEICICIVLYGFPVVSFGLTIIKAYCGGLYFSQSRRHICVKILYLSASVILVAAVLFFLHMFCTIFMDASLLFTRVVFFTFTGVVVYPKISYGYLIFTFTVIYYLWQSVQDYSLVYHHLLKDTVNICSSLQRANDKDRLVIKKGDFKGVKESLFEYVIETHRPKRKQAFISLFKGVVVLTILGLLINILNKTDGFRHLHTVMHVGTALFICAFPQILKKMCHGHREKFKQRRFRRALACTIMTYAGYDINSSDSANEFDD